MSLFQRYFQNQFTSKEYSMPELRKFGGQMLANLIADAPGGFSTVIADFTTCQTSFDATFPEVLGAKGARAEAVANKKAFRKALAAKIAKIAGGIAGAYGDPSAELAGAFPEGRSIFSDCEDVEMLGKLTALKDWFTPARVTAVGAAHQTSINGLVTQWTAIWAALGGAKGELSSDVGTQKEVKATYQACLFTVLLNLALKFPNDEAKFNQYVPEHLLADAETAPPKPTFACVFDETENKPKATMESEGAATFKIQRSTDGGVTFATIIEGATSPWFMDDQSPGTYHYRCIAVGTNGLESEPSDDVEVIVP
jgi:hypothetical protein